MVKVLDDNGLSYFWGKIKSYVTGLGYYTKPTGGIPASDIASGVIPTVPSNIVTGSSQSYTIWSGTQAQYDALATKDNNTIYLIKES